MNSYRYPSAHDPIFKSVAEIFNLLDYAKQKKVRLYLVDAMPFDQWVIDGYPVAVTNAVVLHDVAPNVLFRLPDSWCGVYHHPYALHDTAPITKQFNCFMNRMDIFRQSWLYQLIRHGLFDHGYISFNADIARQPSVPCTDDISQCLEYNAQDAFQDQFEKHLTIFHQEHEFIKPRIPYRNFPDNGDVTAICYASKLSLVLETYFHENDLITYTEKTFRALQIPRPWILFAPRHAVRNLKRIGFDVLDDMIDHDSYDCLDSPVARQTKILDLLSTLADLQLNDSRLQQAALHNQNLLEKFSRNWIQDIELVIEQAAAYA